ncbi:hypothetical protein PJV92_05310 [Aliarcobacter butzleri]|uniref:Uncharacterized protein n=1 Tax=Aliarcobacter butzleri TaxID=28197 RepID=A0AAP4PY75_9BACT|nr:hypothetical protein [Aliarcobacter butzleri]MDN5051350.1 hypothetical protein [Aliarcobacter butzleri]MDN5074219.1 hypothetical protein [Aliarcobacter butzleri]MDN5115636.1 hypothetical protein [Aliarcobacter butzleri]MDN5132136.1 hypothetical protein [Aliarcobacter butzleri]
MDFKNLSIAQILKLQDQLEKELNSRTINLVSVLSTIDEIEKKSLKVKNFYDKKIKILKSKNEELKQLEEMGFSMFLYSSGNIGIINYEIKDKPNQYYGCEIDVDLKDVVFRESMYLESSHLGKIKEILKLI